jgi:hypothetical protein
MSFRDHITRKKKNWALFHSNAFFLGFLSKERDTNVLTEKNEKARVNRKMKGTRNNSKENEFSSCGNEWH